MLKSKKPGISVVETLLVIAISSALFVVVIGVFNTTKKVQADDSARQVMDTIAKVRNEAQQGQALSNPGNPGDEIFGKAVELNGTQMIVHNLAQNPSNKQVIKTYGDDQVIEMPYQLQWYINSTSCPGGFASCIINPASGLGNLANGNIVLVFRVLGGQSYVLNNTVGTNYDYRDFKNYRSSGQINSSQPYIQLAFGKPGNGGSMANAIYQYLALFDLSIPNNQDLKVIK